MVWWVDRITMNNNQKAVCEKYYEIDDRLFQSVNIMFDLSQNDFDAHDIYELLCNGVNIFNIDRTKQNKELYESLKTAVSEAIQMPIMYPTLYTRCVALSITMSVNDPIELDERVDIVILKHVFKIDQVTKYKLAQTKFCLPVLLWISGDGLEELSDLIKVSDGIVFEFSESSQTISSKIACMCKTHGKPLFYSKSNVFEEIRIFNNKPKMLTVATEIVGGLMDGVVIAGNQTSIQKWKEIVLDVVEALDVAENARNPEKWQTMLRMRVKSPQMLPITVMIATSEAALKSGAVAILLLTATGRSAQMLSSVCPPCPILAITAHEDRVRRLHLYRKVFPLHYKGPRAVNWREECRNRALFGSEFAMKTGLYSGQAKLVVLARSEEGYGFCNQFQIVMAPFSCL